MANLATIAAAIVSEINTAATSGTFNRTFEANVLWAKRQQKLEEANKLRVDVAPLNLSRQLFARGVHLQVFNFDVGVRKRFEESEEASGEISDDEVSGLTTLLDGLLEFFMPRQPSKTGRPLTDFPTAWVLGPGSQGDLTIETTIVWDDLESMRQFTGFFPLTIHVAESDAG